MFPAGRDQDAFRREVAAVSRGRGRNCATPSPKHSNALAIFLVGAAARIIDEVENRFGDCGAGGWSLQVVHDGWGK